MLIKGKVALIFIAIFLNQLAWMIFVPLWQTPDEQAHFAQVQNLAETGRIRVLLANNTSREIWQSEKVLGTLRDTLGNNKFTFHPGFNINYSKTTLGLYEVDLATQAKETRHNLVIKEATGYPPLYYFFGSIFYRVVYSGSLFDRVFFVRATSVLAAIGLAIFTYLIGERVFRSVKLSMILTVLVGFQPMLTFVNSGVTSDGLFNLVFTAFTHILLVIMQDGIKITRLLLLLFLIVLGFLAKPQANIMTFVMLPVLIASGIFFLHKKWKKIDTLAKVSILLIGGVIIIVGIKEIVWRVIDGSIFPESNKMVTLSSINRLPEHLSFTANHTYREVLPWFWGVFRWLSLALPTEIRRVTNWLTILSFIGFALYLVRSILEKKLDRKFWALVFLAFSLVTYFSAITLFDFGFRLGSGFSFGIQGRYFFPVIVPFMAIFLVGLQSLVPQKWHISVGKILAVFMIALNVFVFFYLMGSYYKLSFPTFFLEASQYKPMLFKYPINLIVLIANLGLLGLLSLKILIQKEK